MIGYDTISTFSVKTHKSKISGFKTVNQYQVLSCVGRGTHSKVKKVVDKKSKKVFAMKILKRKTIEPEILKGLKHLNIVKLYEIIDDPKHHKSYMIMEYH